MIKNIISVRDIIAFLGDSILSVDGSLDDVFIDNLADAKHVNATTLDWIKPSPQSQILAEESRARTILVGQDVVYSRLISEQNKVLIHVSNPKRALAKIGNAFFVKKYEPGIHPSAIISPGAVLGHDVYIGPFSVIDKAVIGDGCVIESNVRIYDNVTIGKSCYIKPGAVIGGEGFGFERD